MMMGRSIRGKIFDFGILIIFRFVSLLNKINDGSRILVFCKTKMGVDELTRTLRTDGWHGVIGFHGDKMQYVN